VFSLSKKEPAMNIRRVLSVAVLSVAVAGLAEAQDAPKARKGSPLRNAGSVTAKQRPLSSPEFGGVNIQYQRISAMQFTSDVSGDSYTSTWNPPGSTEYQRWFGSPGFNHLVSSPTLPGGARIVYLELDACDSNELDQHVQLTAWNCSYLGTCDAAPLSTLTTTSDVLFPCNNYNDGVISSRVDNYLDQLLLDVTFGATDGSNTFAGVIVGYVLEVSPAPGVATFNDVPTDHPFFQFIEALVESGVTAGCGGGNYCPDNPVTRGQMAVFMSKLTGLSWNGF
jgi:hypothetical protein